jgi:hypothetical protein
MGLNGTITTPSDELRRQVIGDQFEQRIGHMAQDRVVPAKLIDN